MNRNQRLFVVVSLVNLLTSVSAWAEVTRESVTRDLRAEISPVVSEAISQHCFEDCPGYRVDVLFKGQKATVESLDRLGFSGPPARAGSEDVTPASIQVQLLVQQSVDKDSQAKLKQIIAYRAANVSPVPVSVSLKALSGLSPTEERARANASAHAKWGGDLNETVRAAIWPVAILIMAILAFSGLVLFLRNRRELLRERLAALAPKANPEKDEASVLGEVLDQKAVLSLIESRTADLRWLIQDLAKTGKESELAKITALYPAQELTTKLVLDRGTISALARLPEQARADASTEDFRWLQHAIDTAHWKRLEEELEEQRNPLSRINRFQDPLLKSAIEMLRTSSMREAAGFVANLNQDRWPAVLTPLSPESRVELGLALADLQSLSDAERRILELSIWKKISDLDPSFSKGPLELVEEFSLLLSDTEGKKLWQSLSLQMQRKPVTLESMIETLEPAALLEVCMGLEFSLLKTVVASLAPQAQAKLTSALPTALRDRLSRASNEKTHVGSNEAQLMKARAAIVSAYRQMSPLLMAVLTFWTAGLVTACSPQRIFMETKETIIERNAAPRSAIHVDRFLYKRASGQVNVLFVVDNTESWSAGLEFWKAGYEKFVEAGKKSDARLIDYVVQVASSPRGRVPKNFTSREQPKELQLKELFGPLEDKDQSPILLQNEQGYMDLMASTEAGLTHPALAARVGVTLFLIYHLGDDLDPEKPTTTLLDGFKKLATVYAPHQTHIVLLSRMTPAGDGKFPQCQQFFETPKVFSAFGTLNVGSIEKYDLCDPKWGSYEDKTWEAILAFKKRLILSAQPYQPETMMLRAANRSFRYGDDFLVDAASNEIVFTHEPDLIEGDLIEASYFLQPGEDVLSGNPEPVQ